MPYIATDADRTTIYGLGGTAERAIADALAQCADLTDLVAVECTAGLAYEVSINGGSIPWDEVDGVAVLT